MGCCSPNYRNAVNEKEKKVNQKGQENVPLLVKVLGLLITIGGLFTLFLL
jgi:hypothetical protein